NNGEDLENYNNKVEGIPFSVFPARATLPGDVTVTYHTVQGPFVSIASQAARRPTFTVDKEKRTITLIPNTSDMLVNHTYSFTVAHKVNNVTYGYGYLRVKVVERPIYSLNIDPAAAEMPLGGTLDLNITSDLNEAWRQYNTNGRTTCTSSDESVATVAYNNTRQTYVVTMTDDAEKIGESATITLTVNGISAECVVTATGTKYPLWIGGTQVSSENCDDVLGDGTVSYIGGSTGGTLTLKSSTITGGIRSEIPTLTVDLRNSGITVSQASRFSGENTYFTGDCLYKTSSSDNSAALIAKNLIVGDSVILRAWANPPGVEVENLSVVGDSACVQAYSYQQPSMYVTGTLDGTITRPEGAVLNPTTGWVATGPGNLDNYVTNAYVYVKGRQHGTILLGDVNGDKQINVQDVTALITYILGTTPPDFVLANANVNQDPDGNIDVQDVTALINMILD
ncbi:MAG: dockerin type I repeat-containing protein, partial [Muribaculaceae bacterium]|nr:dockerin type I repeat-containing protein [Muribaculaceae bacterium]